MKDLYVVMLPEPLSVSFGIHKVPATEMGAIVVKEGRSGPTLLPGVDELMFGASCRRSGQNVAVEVSVRAHLSYSVPAYTIAWSAAPA